MLLPSFSLHLCVPEAMSSINLLKSSKALQSGQKWYDEVSNLSGLRFKVLVVTVLAIDNHPGCRRHGFWCRLWYYFEPKALLRVIL